MADRRSKDTWRTYLDEPTPLNLLQVERQRVRTYQAPLPRQEGHVLRTGWEIFLGPNRLAGPIYPTWGKSGEVSAALREWLVENHDQRFEGLLPEWFDKLQVVQTTAGRTGLRMLTPSELAQAMGFSDETTTLVPGTRIVFQVVSSPFFANSIMEELEEFEAHEGDADDDHATEVALQAIWTIKAYRERNPESNNIKEALIGISGTWRTLLKRTDEELNTPEEGPYFLPALEAACSGDFWDSAPLLSWNVQTGEAWEGIGKDARQIN